METCSVTETCSVERGTGPKDAVSPTQWDENGTGIHAATFMPKAGKLWKR